MLLKNWLEFFLEISRLVNVKLMLNLAEKSLLAFLRVVQKQFIDEMRKVLALLCQVSLIPDNIKIGWFFSWIIRKPKESFLR